MPVLQHDPMKAEDLDTDSEDHAADMIRYACMARPWLKPEPPTKETPRNDYIAHRHDDLVDWMQSSVKLL
jgi:hypothetical protein